MTLQNPLSLPLKLSSSSLSSSHSSFSAPVSSSSSSRSSSSSTSLRFRFLTYSLLFLVLFSYFSSFITCVLAGRNFYEILGLKKDASTKQIKKAYLRLSKEYHPDRNPSDPNKFLDIGAAYETLSDANKRRLYDQGGEDALKQGGQQQRDPFDIFSSFGFGGQRQGGDAQEQRAADLNLDLYVTLEDLYNGRVFEVEAQQQQLCPHCRGTGAESESDLHVCPVCKGTGQVVRMQSLGPGFVQQIQMPCDSCAGKGKTIKKKCHVCKAAKLVKGKKTLDVVVEVGMSDGSKIEFEHAADEQVDMAAGHVIYHIVTLPHARFERKGNDLHYVQKISLLESLTGFTKVIEHLDGHFVTFNSGKLGEVVSHGQVMKIAKEGMKHHQATSTKGDLFVKFVVEFPKELTEKQRAGFAAILK